MSTVSFSEPYLQHGVNCGCSGCMVRHEQQMVAAGGKALDAEVDSHGEWRIINTPPAQEDTGA